MAAKRPDTFKIDFNLSAAGRLDRIGGLPVGITGDRLFSVRQRFPGAVGQFRDLKPVVEQKIRRGFRIERITDRSPEHTGSKV